VKKGRRQQGRRGEIFSVILLVAISYQRSSDDTAVDARRDAPLAVGSGAGRRPSGVVTNLDAAEALPVPPLQQMLWLYSGYSCWPLALRFLLHLKQ